MDFNLTHLHLPPLEGIPVEFRGDVWHQKTRLPGLRLCGTVMILGLTILVELKPETERQTNNGP